MSGETFHVVCLGVSAVVQMRLRCHNQTMTRDQLDDYRWLVSDEAAAWLEQLREATTPLGPLTRQLRKSLTSVRTHLLLEQVALRRRGAVKFQLADRLFFTSRTLEQATDQWIAAEKAGRFPAGPPVVDLCCGIGGDLFALARRTEVTGVDLDPVHGLFAEANCRALTLPSASIQCADANTMSLSNCAAWHIDPDRRADGQRTIQLTQAQPSLDEIHGMLRQNGNGAIKIAPASPVPPEWSERAERHWIGSGRECRQQVLWFDSLARYPGRHTAQVLHHRAADSRCLVGVPGEPVPQASKLRQFICEPHAAVLAAQLTGALASQYDLLGVDSTVAYLTSDRPIIDPMVSCFAVEDVLPLDVRTIRQTIKTRAIGELEVKKRGVALDPVTLLRQLKPRGDQRATLLITPLGGSIRAILGHRVEPHESAPFVPPEKHD